ncbi:hypothetical protein [Bacillus sp. NPDC094106]|uniref:hypothetical protein n=1 Tax=Bacillus sp. NPDC094106 TaxID=3363949 RepID=UPI0038176098
MKKFDNLATTLVSKWHGKEVEEIVVNNENMDEMNLIALVSEAIEDKIKETLIGVDEGYVSELIGESFENIDYRALIAYYKESSL